MNYDYCVYDNKQGKKKNFDFHRHVMVDAWNRDHCG